MDKRSLFNDFPMTLGSLIVLIPVLILFVVLENIGLLIGNLIALISLFIYENWLNYAGGQ